MAQRLKRLPARRETRVQSLVQEDPLEKEMATHSSILSGESHGWRSLVGYSPRGCKESDTTERLHTLFTKSSDFQPQRTLMVTCLSVPNVHYYLFFGLTP